MWVVARVGGCGVRMGARSGRGCGEGGAPAAEQLGSGEAGGGRCRHHLVPSSRPPRFRPRPAPPGSYSLVLHGLLPGRPGPARGPHSLPVPKAAFAAAGGQWPAEPSPPPPPCPSQRSITARSAQARPSLQAGKCSLSCAGVAESRDPQSLGVAGDIANDAWPERAQNWEAGCLGSTAL